MRRLLITAALPYANGADSYRSFGRVHPDGYLGSVPKASWPRSLVCLCRRHSRHRHHVEELGRRGRPETELIADMSAAHQRDFDGFGIEFDNYGSTHSNENREICGEFWQKLRDADLVVERSIEQLYDPEAETFLADRFVRGSCPKCGAADQAGDNCTVCGQTYDPTDLVDPKSTVSGATPVLKSADHLFIELEKLRGFLSNWVDTSGALQPEIANYLRGEFLSDELRDWDISRPSPYFGFEIPDSPGNYWYVWFDAPIGYIASTKQWCNENGSSIDHWWKVR